MTQVFVHYFSGTGNTKRAVDLIAAELKKNGYKVQLFLIGKGIPQIQENAALNLFAFPVLSWAAPEFVTRYIHRLPEGRGAKAAVCAVCAGGPVQALQSMERLLKRKQFDVFLTGTAFYPDNWTQMMNPPDETEQKEMIQVGDQMVLDFSAGFIKGERRLFRSSWWGNLLTGSISVLFRFMGSRFLGKAYIADSKCNQCGLCVRTCPVKTIRMKGFGAKKPFWGLTCQDCGRCINICPQKSIQVSIARLFLHTIIFSGQIWVLLLLSSWMVKLLPSPYQTLGGIVAVIPAILVALGVQIMVIDHLFFLLEQIPGFDRFFQWSFTRKFRRYTAPGFKSHIGTEG